MVGDWIYFKDFPPGSYCDLRLAVLQTKPLMKRDLKLLFRREVKECLNEGWTIIF